MELSRRQSRYSLASLGSSWCRRVWQSLSAAAARRTSVRQLRICESVSLGEKRLIAVVEYEKQRFLVGGSAQSVNLLARLGAPPDFSELMTEWCERQR